MSDISGLLIKDSFDYIIYCDFNTGVIYRIGGNIPINPKFLSGLTVNGSFTFSDGNEEDGYVLTSDGFGNATWKSFTGKTISGDFLPLSGGTVTGNTSFTEGLSVTTFSATTYQGLPLDIFVTGGTYSDGILTFFNNSGGTFNISGLTTPGIMSATTVGSGISPISDITNGNINLKSFSGTSNVSVLENNDTIIFSGKPSYGFFGLTIDGRNSDITTGKKGYIVVPYGGDIIEWSIISSGYTDSNIIIDVVKYNTLPSSGDSITGGNYIILNNQQINKSNDLSGWTTTINENDIFSFNVLSASSVNWVNVILKILKT